MSDYEYVPEEPTQSVLNDLQDQEDAEASAKGRRNLRRGLLIIAFIVIGGCITFLVVFGGGVYILQKMAGLI